MQRICGSLIEFGFNVTLVGRMTRASTPLKEQAYRQLRLSCLFDRGPFFYMEINIRLFLFLVRANADIICSVDLDTLPAGWLKSKVGKVHLVYDAHEYFPESPELEGRRFKRWLWSKAESFLIPRVDSAYTVSESIKETFELKYSTSFEVVRNLPILWYPDPIPNPGEAIRYMLYQGALNVGRGLEEIISIIPQLDIELWIAGDGDLSAELRSLAAETAPGKIKFLGKVSPDELRQITASAFLGINLLQPLGMSYIMSLSNKFFDYIMAEIPQVCIDFEEYRKVNANHNVAVLVADLLPETLFTAVRTLIHDNQLREGLIANCRKAKLELNWTKESEKLHNSYNEFG